MLNNYKMKFTELWGELYIPITSEEIERSWGPLYKPLTPEEIKRKWGPLYKSLASSY